MAPLAEERRSRTSSTTATFAGLGLSTLHLVGRAWGTLSALARAHRMSSVLLQLRGSTLLRGSRGQLVLERAQPVGIDPHARAHRRRLGVDLVLPAFGRR